MYNSQGFILDPASSVNTKGIIAGGWGMVKGCYERKSEYVRQKILKNISC